MLEKVRQREKPEPLRPTVDTYPPARPKYKNIRADDQSFGKSFSIPDIMITPYDEKLSFLLLRKDRNVAGPEAKFVICDHNARQM